MKRKLIFLSLLLLSTWIVRADEPVRFTASAPSTVILDKPFQLVYSINASGRDLRAPEINNFDVLAGPFQSQSSSIQIVNGCLLYTSPSPRDGLLSRMPSSA